MNSDLSRRDFLSLVGAGVAAGGAALQAQSANKRLFAYVASWTSGPGIGVGNGGGISVFSVDTATGALTPVMRTGQEFDKMNTGYLAVNPNGRFLYATNEVESYDNEYGECRLGEAPRCRYRYRLQEGSFRRGPARLRCRSQ